MAGIAAAKALHKGGATDFLILEAKNRIGGRMHSKEFGGYSRGAGSKLSRALTKTTLESTSVNPLWKEAQRCGHKRPVLPQYDRIIFSC